jgi:tetratricopeptide (TPR) repeat protein
MGIHIKDLYSHRSITEIATSRIMFAFAQALMTAAWAEIFVSRGLSNSMVGSIKFISSTISLILAFILPYYLQKKDESKIYPLSIMASGILILMLLLSESKFLLIIIFAAMQLIFIIRNSTFSIIFRDSFKKFENYSTAQGILGSAVCLAWFAGPIIGGFVMGGFGATGVLLAGGLFFLLASIAVISKLPARTTKKITASINPLMNIKKILKLKGFKRAYLIKSGVDAWWTLVFSFVPLLMIRNGYSIASVGLFIGFSQLPLFFAEFKEQEREKAEKLELAEKERKYLLDKMAPGRNYMSQGNYYKAIMFFEDFLLKPISVEDIRVEVSGLLDESKEKLYAITMPLIQEADLAFENKQFKKSYETYEKILEKDPSLVDIIIKLGQLKSFIDHRIKDRYQKAILSESYGYLEESKQYFSEILDTTPEKHIFYKKSEQKLLSYIND